MKTIMEAIERLREIDHNRTIVANCEYNRALSNSPHYKIWMDIHDRTPLEIVEIVEICREHLFNFTFYDGMIKEAHKESLNFF